MKVPAHIAESVRTRWPDRADPWLNAVEPELEDLCRRYSATPRRVMPARYGFVVAADTPNRGLILRATTDPDATAQTTVARSLAELGIAPAIHATHTTETGAWTVMEEVRPGTPLADADPSTVDLDALAAPLRAMANAPAPADDLPHIAEWLRHRLTDETSADLPPGEVRAEPAERTRALAQLDELAGDSWSGLCHGDASPWNVLAGPQGRWLLIDPRGMTGEAEYDAAVMAIKITAAVPGRDVTALLADTAGFNCDRVRAWIVVARTARV